MDSMKYKLDFALEELRSFGRGAVDATRLMPPALFILFVVTAFFGIAAMLYITIFVVAPIPRIPRKSEKTYTTVLPDGERSEGRALPCWIDEWNARRKLVYKEGKAWTENGQIEEPNIFMSVVVPAYNEEKRLQGMLEEAVAFLEQEYSSSFSEEALTSNTKTKANGGTKSGSATKSLTGWEILVVSDGSEDGTEKIALDFARRHQVEHSPEPVPGPRTPKPNKSTHISSGSIRVVKLEENRGKGGAVTHGMRHVRGKYVVFADADGASKFDDLESLVKGCKSIEDDLGRGIAIGSRAHLVGSEAVVKRSFLRNFLMHSFHLFLWILTPPATSAIGDTQCGFKLFSRPSLPYIIPYMHSEGWIFDVEMLMLAESANIRMIEIPIGWKEVAGSKLNVVADSLGMAWGLAILRAAWGIGVYTRS